MSTVYVTQEIDRDFSDARRYGEVVFLTHEDLNDNGSQKNADVVKQIRQQITNFNPDVDWLVVAGSPYIAGVAFWLLGRYKYNRIRVLRWDNREFKYRPMYMVI